MRREFNSKIIFQVFSLTDEHEYNLLTVKQPLYELGSVP